MKANPEELLLLLLITSALLLLPFAFYRIAFSYFLQPYGSGVGIPPTSAMDGTASQKSSSFEFGASEMEARAKRDADNGDSTRDELQLQAKYCRVPGVPETQGKLCMTAAWSSTRHSVVPTEIREIVSVGFVPARYQSRSEQFTHNIQKYRSTTNVYVFLD